MAKIFDFERRCAQFVRELFTFLEKLPKTGPNQELCGQMYRSGPSIVNNYVEADDPLGKKDRVMKLRTSRREASETRNSLGLVICPSTLLEERARLLQELDELRRILTAMIRKSQ